MWGWLAEAHIETAYIAPGSPWENAYVESFNGKLRGEFLDRKLFASLAAANRPRRCSVGSGAGSGPELCPAVRRRTTRDPALNLHGFATGESPPSEDARGASISTELNSSAPGAPTVHPQRARSDSFRPILCWTRVPFDLPRQRAVY